MADRDPSDLHEPASGARTPARFTLGQFDRMIEAGVFDGPGSAELVRGEIVHVNAKYLPHIANQDELLVVLRQLFRFRADIRVYSEGSIQIDPETTRETDVAIVRPQQRGTRRFSPQDVLLAIEIADSSLRRDLGDKLQDYARANIPRVWVIDLNGEVVHLCAAPGPDGYSERRVARFGEPISLAPLLDAELIVPPGGFE